MFTDFYLKSQDEQTALHAAYAADVPEGFALVERDEETDELRWIRYSTNHWFYPVGVRYQQTGTDENGDPIIEPMPGWWAFIRVRPTAADVVAKAIDEAAKIGLIEVVDDVGVKPA